MNSLSELTVIIVTYQTDRKILKDCINSINKDVQIKIIENSNLFENEDLFLKEYQNLSIYCTGKNLGYGGGNNFGFEKTKTNFALVLNPDIICDKEFFENIKIYLDNKINFSIIGTSLKNKSIFNTSGQFNENKNKIYEEDQLEKFLKRVNWVVGSSMLFNLKKFEKKKIFDENFFLYFEEFDLCKKLEKEKNKVYTSSKLLVTHLGYKGSFAANPKLTLLGEKLRNWHWMWSTFYFYKSNYGILFAYRKTFSKLIKSSLKFIYYYLSFNDQLSSKYKYRFLGLLNSMKGKKSWFRINLP